MKKIKNKKAAPRLKKVKRKQPIMILDVGGDLQSYQRMIKLMDGKTINLSQSIKPNIEIKDRHGK